MQQLHGRHMRHERCARTALVELDLRETVVDVPVALKKKFSAVAVVQLDQICEILGINDDVAVDLVQGRRGRHREE